MKNLQHVTEWKNVNRRVFEEEIIPQQKPAVLRSLASNWPAVRAGLDSPGKLSDYIKGFDSGQSVTAIIGSPDIKGRFFYADDLKSFNFDSKRGPVSAILDTLASLQGDAKPPSIAVQAIPVPVSLPGFERSNPLPLLDDTVAPRIWLGNRATIAPHIDNNHNIACVVAGRRRFTLFPPEEVANLYIGPLLNTPGGAPVSMVELRQPDHAKYPRFKRAMEAAQQVVLEPGDAICIPALWWHGVEALDDLNVLVNYWWNEVALGENNPFFGLLHSMLMIARLPANQRQAWQTLFGHFVFQQDGDSAAHLPSDLKDLQGSLSSEEQAQVRLWLSQQLKPKD